MFNRLLQLSHSLPSKPMTLVCGCGLLLWGLAFNNLNAAKSDETQTAEAAKQLPIDELRAFAEIYKRIKSAYVEDVSDKKLINGAIAGMLNSLDPHSSYLNKDNFERLKNSSAGEYGGLGIEVAPDENSIRIIAPIDNSPAAQAGIKAGDLLIGINNAPISKLPANEALALMRGELGETVKLTIRREGESEPLEFSLVRSVIQYSSLNSELLGAGIGYVRIVNFQQRTGQDLIQALEQLKQANGSSLQGLILDLRNNPGGVLTAAEQVSDSFLETGMVVATKGKLAASTYSYYAKPGDLLGGAPIIVLINHGSASASEIVAGALQDHKRALVMGTRSFGKGSVQSLMAIPGDEALKLTTALYYTPSGRSIQGSGITPDIKVLPGEVSLTDEQQQFFESDLKGALVNQQAPSQQTSSQQVLSNDENISANYQLTEQQRDNLKRDLQLNKAHAVIRALTLIGARY
jgi:carboxyl-terminal processing protease